MSEKWGYCIPIPKSGWVRVPPYPINNVRMVMNLFHFQFEMSKLEIPNKLTNGNSNWQFLLILDTKFLIQKLHASPKQISGHAADQSYAYTRHAVLF